jgi:molecular chaperone DnaK
VKIEVTFHIDSEGILNLSARDQSTGQTVESTLKLSMGKDKEEAEAPPEKAAEPKPAASKAAAPAEPDPLLKAPLKAPALGMPRSTLASDIGGPAAPAEEERTAMASAPPDRLSPANLGAAEPSAPPAADAPKGDINDELARAREAALARKTGDQTGAKEEPGVFGKVIGWFKGLFGG